MIGHPLFARLLFLRLGDQQGANGLAFAQANEGVGFTAPSNDSGCARTGGTLGRQNFGDHAATANAGAHATSHGL